MISHSGIIMSLGKGATDTTSRNSILRDQQKLNVVAIDDGTAQFLWTRHFLAAQGMYIPTTTIYQYNKSTNLLAEKASNLAADTRHLNLQYFSMMDKIKRIGHIRIFFNT